jgi:anti-sigma28 factor (negative regulator of flagellin synthesis)
MKIEDLKIKVKPRYNYGYKVGVTVHINGKKFPKKRNYVYAHNEDNKAIKTALIDGNYHNDNELVASTLKKDMKERGLI